MAGRTLAVGDVHGCHTALITLLDMLRVTPQDTIVFLGDVVDRGPSSNQVITEILALRRRCGVVVLTGNHEEMMRSAISGRGLYSAWLEAGGQATLESYGGDTRNIPAEHIRLLVSTSAYYETDSNICVHASLESRIGLPNQTSDYLRWKHIGGTERPHVSGKRVICGHTPQTDGVPFVFDGWVCIDTFAHGGKWLTCLNLEDDWTFQASQRGERREFPLALHSSV